MKMRNKKSATRRAQDRHVTDTSLTVRSSRHRPPTFATRFSRATHPYGSRGHIHVLTDTDSLQLVPRNSSLVLREYVTGSGFMGTVFSTGEVLVVDRRRAHRPPPGRANTASINPTHRGGRERHARHTHTSHARAWEMRNKKSATRRAQDRHVTAGEARLHPQDRHVTDTSLTVRSSRHRPPTFATRFSRATHPYGSRGHIHVLTDTDSLQLVPRNSSLVLREYVTGSGFMGTVFSTGEVLVVDRRRAHRPPPGRANTASINPFQPTRSFW